MSTTTALESSILATNVAAEGLKKQAQGLAKVVEQVLATADLQANQLIQVAQAEAKLKELDVQFAEDLRSKKVETDIALREDQLAKVNQILASQGKQSVDKAEYTELLTQLQDIKNNFEARVETQVEQIKASAAKEIVSALRNKDLEHQVKEASNVAAIKNLEDKLAFVSGQVKEYQGQLNAEREARVKSDQARGQAVVNVGSSK